MQVVPSETIERLSLHTIALLSRVEIPFIVSENTSTFLEDCQSTVAQITNQKDASNRYRTLSKKGQTSSFVNSK